MDDKFGYRVLAKGVYADNDTYKTHLNNNDLIIGPSGAGKTRGYVEPNLSICNHSMVVCDTKRNLYTKYAKSLEKRGFKTLCVDFTDMDNSLYGYNPLSYLPKNKNGYYNEQEMMNLAAQVVTVDDPRQAFWEYTAREYFIVLLNYTMNYLPENEHNMNTILKLMDLLREGIYDPLRSPFNKLIGEIEEIDPDCSLVQKYNGILTGSRADKAVDSIFFILEGKLSLFTFEGARIFYNNPRQIEFEKLGEEKTIVFLNISDTQRGIDKMVNVFYSQAISALTAYADSKEDNRLPVPVRFMMDDFATNCKFDGFDNIISTVRSREIYISMVVQSLSQLTSLYGDSASSTILNNCDSILYLGGQDLNTVHYISQRSNIPLYEIMEMPVGKMLLLRRGSKALITEREDIASFREENYGGEIC